MTEEREEKHEAPGFDRGSAIPIGWILADTVGLLVMRHSRGVNAQENRGSVESKVKMLLFMLFTADCLQIKLCRIWHMNSNCPR